MSTTIRNHPLVIDCEVGDWGGDKKYFVHCVPGYWFDGFDTASKSFDSVAEFKRERIVPRTDSEGSTDC